MCVCVCGCVCVCVCERECVYLSECVVCVRESVLIILVRVKCP